MAEKPLRNVIEYDSNNSGGSWWLSDDHWKALENAGWVVHWIHDRETQHGEHVHAPSTSAFAPRDHRHSYEDILMPAEPTGERWLGALATSAAKVTTDPAKTVREFERITGQDASEQGCNCCGEPHNFVYRDSDGNRQSSFVEVVRSELRWS